MAVAGLMLSAMAFIGLVSHEGFTDSAVIPTKNDRPTVGYGSTFWEDGKPVQMGQKVTPVRALRVAQVHITKEEVIFRNSMPGVQLSQVEYDTYMDWVYQYGTGAWSGSSMRTKLLRADYAGACGALLAYKFSGGYDCSTLVNGRPNQRCWGVWERQQARYKTCMGAQ
jgi:GH24 family phage-related lysozyme (muramidase)